MSEHQRFVLAGDVNVTELVARALDPSAFDPKSWPPITFGQSLAEAREQYQEEALDDARRALAALRPPEVVAGIERRIHDHECGCAYDGEHSWEDIDRRHTLAQAVVDWLAGGAR